MAQKKCDFIIIGAMKGGTSSLAELLDTHPQVCMSNPKEPHFFSKRGSFPEELSSYHGLFENGEGKLWGEGTTSYTKMPNFKPEIYKDLYSYNPNLKFVFALRHPVSRAVSHYMHMYQRKAFDYSFSEALWQSNILHTGRYYTQLRPYVELFGKEKIHLYQFENFIDDQDQTLQEVLNFLSLPWPEDGFTPVHSNSSLGANKLGASVERLKTPAMRKFWDEKVPLSAKKTLYKVMAKATARTFDEKVSVSPAIERQILELHRLDILEIEKWTGWDLTGYLTTLDGSHCVR